MSDGLAPEQLAKFYENLANLDEQIDIAILITEFTNKLAQRDVLETMMKVDEFLSSLPTELKDIMLTRAIIRLAALSESSSKS
jgi:hypothetical protein